MKFYESKNGSVNCFYRGKLVVSVGLDDIRTIDYYKYAAERLLIEGMQHGHKLPELKEQFMKFIKKIRYQEITKKKITREDRETILLPFLMLCRLKEIDPDGNKEGLLICPRKKSKQEKQIRSRQH